MDKQGRKKVLIVDDDWAVREMLSGFLRNKGFEVETVEGVIAAKRAIDLSRPDIIILDVKMPEFSGIDLQWYLRICRRIMDIPVLFCTVKDKSVVEGCMREFDQYVQKPNVTLEEIYERINKTFEV